MEDDWVTFLVFDTRLNVCVMSDTVTVAVEVTELVGDVVGELDSDKDGVEDWVIDAE
jgi:hypothetical protein